MSGRNNTKQTVSDNLLFLELSDSPLVRRCQKTDQKSPMSVKFVEVRVKEFVVFIHLKKKTLAKKCS